MELAEFNELIKHQNFHPALGGATWEKCIEQNADELFALCSFIRDNKIETYFEIGLSQGGLYRFMQSEMKLKCYGVTLDPTSLHEGLFNIIYGRSQDFLVLKSVAAHVESVGKFGLIFVDAAHDYDSVRLDYENYKDKCKFMAFHDILGLRNCEGSKKHWNEIKGDKYIEFICQNESIASGIGILKMCE